MTVRDPAALARLVGVTRARVTQVLDLLRLAPGIQEEVLFLPWVREGGDHLRHRDLLAVAGCPVCTDQRRARDALASRGGGYSGSPQSTHAAQ